MRIRPRVFAALVPALVLSAGPVQAGQDPAAVEPGATEEAEGTDVPVGARAALARAEGRLKARDFDGALQAIEECIALAPDWYAPYLVRDSVRMEIVGPNTSVEDLQRPVAGRDYDAMAEQLRAAAQDLGKVVELDPDAEELDLWEVRADQEDRQARAEAATAAALAVASGGAATPAPVPTLDPPPPAVEPAAADADEAARRIELRRKRQAAGGGVLGGGLALGVAAGGFLIGSNLARGKIEDGTGYDGRLTGNDPADLHRRGNTFDTLAIVCGAVGLPLVIAGAVMMGTADAYATKRATTALGPGGLEVRF